jgi:nitric oxide dioxygenase
MEAIGKVLGDAVTPEIGAAWSESVLFLAKVLIDAEEVLYASAAERPGGWSGFVPFKVSAVEQLTDDVRAFRLERDGAAAVGIDFSPGQFVTLRVDPNGDGLTAPRQYTLTSSPGEDTLECTIKKVSEGDGVSRFMFDHVAVGSTVEISPPFGVFNVRQNGRKAVLVSAGIGMTPMITLGKELGDRLALVAHVDGSPALHPYADRLASMGAPTLFKYACDEEGGKMVPPAQLAAEVLAAVGAGAATDCDFYVCGSPGFESGVTKALRAAGVTAVYSETSKGHTDGD